MVLKEMSLMQKESDLLLMKYKSWKQQFEKKKSFAIYSDTFFHFPLSKQRTIIKTLNVRKTNLCLSDYIPYIAKIENYTDFTMASGFVKIAMDEFYSHNPNNLTGLVQRYWTIVENDISGELFLKISRVMVMLSQLFVN